MSLNSALTFEHVIKDTRYGYDYRGYGLEVSEYASGYSQDTGWRPSTGVSAETFYFKGSTATVSNWEQFHGPSLLVNHSANCDYTRARSWFSCKYRLASVPPQAVLLWYQGIPILTAGRFVPTAGTMDFRADVCVDRERDEIRVYANDVLVQVTPFWRGLSRQPTCMIRFGTDQKINLGGTAWRYFSIWFKDIIFYDDTEDDTLCSPVGDYDIVNLPVVNAVGTGWSVVQGSTGTLTLTQALNNRPDSATTVAVPRADAPDNGAVLTYGLNPSALRDNADILGLFTLHNGYQYVLSKTLRLKYRLGDVVTPEYSMPYVTRNVMDYGLKTPMLNKAPSGVRWTKQLLSQLSVETAIP